MNWGDWYLHHPGLYGPEPPPAPVYAPGQQAVPQGPAWAPWTPQLNPPPPQAPPPMGGTDPLRDSLTQGVQPGPVNLPQGEGGVLGIAGLRQLQGNESLWDTLNPFSTAGVGPAPQAPAGPPATPPDATALVNYLRGTQGNGPGGASTPISYDLGGGVLPRELFQEYVAGVPAPVSHSGLLKNLPAPERIERQIAPPTDYTEAERYWNEAAPDKSEPLSLWDGIMMGLAKAGAGVAQNDLSTGDALLMLGSGLLGGVAGTKQEQAELDREYSRSMDEYYGQRAGWEGDKAQQRRTEMQQGLDTDYEADTAFQAQRAAYAADTNQILSRDIDSQNAYRQQLAVADAARRNAATKGDLAFLQQSQPQATVDSRGRIIIQDIDPETGHKRIRVDNKSVYDTAQATAISKALGGGGGSKEFAQIMGDPPQGPTKPIWELSARLSMAGPEMLKSTLPPEVAEEIIRLAPPTGDAAVDARRIGNATYATLLNMVNSDPERLLDLLTSMAIGPE